MLLWSKNWNILGCTVVFFHSGLMIACCRGQEPAVDQPCSQSPRYPFLVGRETRAGNEFVRGFMPKLAETITKDKPVPLVNVFKEFQPQSENWTFLKRKEPFKPSTLYSFGHVQNSYFPFLPCSSLQSFSGWWVIRRGKPGADYLFLHIIRHL